MMNRKEFKSLLTEWNQKFINERSFKSLDIPEWGTAVSDQQEEMIKSINLKADMINFPMDANLLRTHSKKSLYKLLENNFSIFEKNEKNYNLIKKAVLNFYKSVVLNPRSYKKRDVKDINARLQYEFGNPDMFFDREEKIDKDRVLKNIESLFEDSKNKMTGKSSEDNFDQKLMK